MNFGHVSNYPLISLECLHVFILYHTWSSAQVQRLFPSLSNVLLHTAQCSFAAIMEKPNPNSTNGDNMKEIPGNRKLICLNPIIIQSTLKMATVKHKKVRYEVWLGGGVPRGMCEALGSTPA